MKVTLRKKPILKGKQSLYLDFYPPIPNTNTGKLTRREFLNLYVFDKPKNEFDKLHNKETLQLAESIRSQRQLEIQKESYGFLSAKKSNVDFLQHFRELREKKKNQQSEYDNWNSAVKYLEKFAGGKLLVSQLNENLCNEFREFLLNTNTFRSDKNIKKKLSKNTANTYFGRFRTALRKAYRIGLLTSDLSAKIDGIKREETHREYLTDAELQALVKAECHIPVLKRAALFSALTGLRYSDIEKLVWSEVRQNTDGYCLQFIQKKTKGAEVLTISEQAYKLMGEPGAPSDRVFTGLSYSGYANIHLKWWIMNAGINKKITFHNFRHTHATLLLSKGVDIYTVSKRLGHRDLSTTQIYANVVGEKKREAAEKIQLEF